MPPWVPFLWGYGTECSQGLIVDVVFGGSRLQHWVVCGRVMRIRYRLRRSVGASVD